MRQGLLFVRQFAENPATGEFNPMVLLLAMDSACISRTSFPKGVEEHGTVQQIATQTIDYFRTDRQIPTGPARVRAFSNAGRLMIDISQSFTLTEPGQAVPMTTLSSILAVRESKFLF